MASFCGAHIGLLVLVFFFGLPLLSFGATDSPVHNCFPSVDEGDNTTDLGQVWVTETPTDGPLSDIIWVADMRSNAELKESLFIRTQRGRIYRSIDLGRSWTDVMGSLQGSLTPVDGNTGVARMYSTRASVVFLGYGGNMWTWTSAMGFTKMNTMGKTFTRIRMHPYESGWILAATGSRGCYDQGASGSCFGVLYLTKDHGHSWQPILDYVADYSWGNPGAAEAPETVYAITWDDKTKNQNSKDYWDMKLKKTKDFFKNSNELVLDHCVGFIFTDHRTLWAIQPVSRYDFTLRLFTSTDGGRTVQEAQFPKSPDVLAQGRYTILDTREGMTFINVEHGTANWGHLYTSDATDRKYSLSLEFNSRLPYGAVDFERVEGLDGIYLANYVLEEGRGQLSTVITTDKGAEWYHLAPASEECKANTHCHLHLFGFTSGHPQFYSMESALGLMLGLGNEGTHLMPFPIDTYVSRDAGLTWSLARKGSHNYEYGDHGGLIVMSKNREPTSEIVFSWNEGDTWHPCHFSELPVRVYNIMSGSGPLYGSSQKFVGYGRRGDVDVLWFFDFSQLHERKCEGQAFPDTPTSDYELWVPGRRTSVGQCLLGRHITYVRRKPSAQCVNGDFFNRGTITTLCPCGREDFTCDYCYEVPESDMDHNFDDCILSAECKAAGFDPVKAPEDCNGTYPVTRGYRLIVGDQCILTDGDPHLPKMTACPPKETDSGTGGKVPLLWIIAGICIIFAAVAVLAVIVFFAVKLAKSRGFRVLNPSPGGPSVEDATGDEEL